MKMKKCMHFMNTKHVVINFNDFFHALRLVCVVSSENLGGGMYKKGIQGILKVYPLIKWRKVLEKWARIVFQIRLVVEQGLRCAERFEPLRHASIPLKKQSSLPIGNT